MSDGTPSTDQGPRLRARPLAELTAPASEGDSNTLLGNRFLTRGGGLLLVGPTGIGKSSFSMQCMLKWALGEEMFGIRPARPLQSVLIQAENDDGDLAEMRDGVINGLGLSSEKAQQAVANVWVLTDSIYTGSNFFSMIVAPVLRAHTPQLLWIDPALAYIGGDAVQQEVVGGFLRNGLNPLLQQYGCGAVIVHHTSKPKQDKPSMSPADLAYIGAGSAEWANWSRAILSLQPTQERNIYRLHAAKRGQRIGWVEADGRTKAYTKTIAHATGGNEIYWREASASEVEATNQPTGIILPEKAAIELPTIGTTEKSMFLSVIQRKFDIGEKKARALLNRMLSSGLMYDWEIPRPGSRPAVHVARIAQPKDYKLGDEDPKSSCWRQGDGTATNKT